MQIKIADALSYNPVTGIFLWRVRRGIARAGKKAGCIDTSTGYRRIRINGEQYYEHRLAWLFVYGEFPPPDLEIDHRNRDTADNRIANLRLATHSQNCGNAIISKNNTSGAKGIHLRLDTRKWSAAIMKNRKRIYLGCFDEKTDAIAAYASAAKKFFGEFARIS